MIWICFKRKTGSVEVGYKRKAALSGKSSEPGWDVRTLEANAGFFLRAKEVCGQGRRLMETTAGSETVVIKIFNYNLKDRRCSSED